MPEQLPLFDQYKPPISTEVIWEQQLDPIQIEKDHATSPGTLVPSDSLFGFTRNYYLTGSLLGRILRALDEKSKGDGVMNREELAQELTIPTKRVDALFTFLRKTELVTMKNRLTPFGQLVLIFDPYLLDVGLLWFFHHFISSNARLVIWSRLFNTIAYKEDEIKPHEILTYFTDVKGEMSDHVFQKNGRNEIGAVLRTYSDELFRSLGLVIKIDMGRYSVISDEFPIPPLIWLASILAYRDRYYPGAATLETHLLVDAHFSPGRLFRQNESAVRRALDTLHNAGLLTIESRLGLDQVRFKSEHTWLSALAQYLREGR